jgi:hypothetical protein
MEARARCFEIWMRFIRNHDTPKGFDMVKGGLKGDTIPLSREEKSKVKQNTSLGG